MKEYDAVELAYQNGYEAGKRDSVKEGVWIINPDGYYPYCSVCHYEPERYASNTDNRTPHCPRCGAKLKKETD